MKLINIFKEFKGKPFMQDIPNEFAYLDFKKWAYPRRGKIKQKLQIVLDNNQSDPGTSFFRELTRIWVMWANKNSEEFSIVNPTNVGQKDFGRALAIMMKKDNLIIQKDTNKLLDLIEDYKPSHRAYNVIDKSNNDEIVAKELPRHKALELSKTNKNYMIDATDRLAEDDVDDDDRFHGMDDVFGADLEEDIDAEDGTEFKIKLKHLLQKHATNLKKGTADTEFKVSLKHLLDKHVSKGGPEKEDDDD